MKRVLVVAWLALMPGLAAHPAGQSAGGTRFEVASVKPSDPNAVGPFGKPPALPETRVAGGRFSASNSTLRDLVKLAYDFWFDFRIDAGADWQTSRRFDIQAKAEDPAADMGAMRPMIRALLADRFKLKIHTETRELPIFVLVVARDDGRLGANIKPSTADCSNPPQVPREDFLALLQAGRVPCAVTPMPSRVAGTAVRGNGASMAALAQFLWSPTGRIVHDRTGLSGLYDWEMTYDRGVTNLPLSPSTSDSPVLTTALQEQLGLKLESTRGPVEVLVIDSAALPEPD
jgi:uncharacterized protein (TIGR03435 family)